MKNLISRINSLNEEQKRIFVSKLIEKGIELPSELLEVNGPNIQPVDIRDFYPVSYAQERWFIINKLNSDNSVYNITNVYEISGSIDENKISIAFNKLIEKHEILRTVFYNLSNGEILQKVIKNYKIDIARYNLGSNSINQMIDERIKPFDYSVLPLFNIFIISESNIKHYLIIDFAHIICDGLSIPILIKDFINIYRGKEAIYHAIQYKDFACWQKSVEGINYIKSGEKYWLDKFNRNLPKNDIYTDYPRIKNISDEGEEINILFDEEFTSRIKVFVGQNHFSIFSFFLSALTIIISKLTNENEVIIGVPFSGRYNETLDNIVGVMINTVPILSSINEHQEVIQFIKETNQSIILALQNQQFDYEMLLDKLKVKRAANRNTLFDVLFNSQNIPFLRENSEQLSDELKLKIYTEYKKGTTPFDMTLYYIENIKTINVLCTYRTSLFKKETIELIFQEFRSIIDKMINNKKMKIGELDVFKKLPSKFYSTKELLFEDNSISSKETVVSIFDKIAEKYPSNRAVVVDDETVTYRELCEKTNEMASVILKNNNIKYENPNIGLLFDHGVDMVVGLMGVLKTGFVTIPLDPSYPILRILTILRDSSIDLILTNSTYENLAEVLVKKANTNITVININTIKNTHCNTLLSKIKIEPKSCAMILYTSGSGGKPKGVMQSHENLTFHYKCYIKELNITPLDNIVNLSTYTHSASLFDVFSALLTGATLFPYDLLKEGRYNQLEQWISKERISIFHSVPSIYRQLLKKLKNKASIASVNLVVLGGEEVLKVDFELFKENFNDACKFINFYGMSELMVSSFNILGKSDKIERNTVPIGQLIKGVEMQIVEENNKVEVGVFGTGEIFYKSDYLFIGYLNLPEEMANVNGGIKGGAIDKIYRSGDIARLLPNQEIEFLGKNDNQIKLFGNRANILEIENLLLDLEYIKECAVLPKESPDKNKFLEVYYSSDYERDENKIKDYLLLRIPLFMMPANYIFLKEIPKTNSGKIDRKELLKIDRKPKNYNHNELNIKEKKLATIISKILKVEVEKVGLHSNFFEIGGNSLLASLLISKIYNEFDIKLKLSDIFMYSSVYQLVKLIEKGSFCKYKPILPVEKKEYYTASPSQKGMFLLNQHKQNDTSDTAPFLLEIKGSLTYNSVQNAYNKIIQTHEAFRTSFKIINNNVVQVIHKDVGFVLDYEEIDEFIIHDQIRKLVQPFNLDRAPLFTAKLIKLKKDSNTHYLFTNIHHIITDVTSDIIFIRDLLTVFQGNRINPLNIQYKDYSNWHNTMLKTHLKEKQREFWLDQLLDYKQHKLFPTDYERTDNEDFTGDYISFSLSLSDSSLVRNFINKHSLTNFIFFCSAHHVLLSYYMGCEDVIIGTPVAGRNHPDVEDIIGFFVNTIVLRSYVAHDLTIIDYLKLEKEKIIAALDNQDYPFDDLIYSLNKEKHFSKVDLLSNFFVYHNEYVNSVEIFNKIEYPKFKFIEFNQNSSPFDITIHATDKNDVFHFRILYKNMFFKKDTMVKFGMHYKNLIKSIINNPNSKISSLNFLTDDEKKQVEDITSNSPEISDFDFNL